MKLLSSKEVTDKKQSDMARDISRSKEVKSTLEALTKNLAETEARFNVALANQRVRYAKEEEEYLEKIQELRSETKVLEDRKKEALVPIVERENKAYDLLKQAEEKGTLAEERYEEANALIEKEEELTNLLEDKLDTLSDKETDLMMRIKKQAVNESNFLTKSELANNALNARESLVKASEVAVGMKLITLEQREQALDRKEKYLNERDIELNKKNRAIQDKYETLQRTITRVTK